MFDIKTLRECACEEYDRNAALLEKWSDAARAASAAGRKRAGKGLSSRKQAAHGAYNKAITDPHQRHEAARSFHNQKFSAQIKQDGRRGGFSSERSKAALTKRIGAKGRMARRMEKGAQKRSWPPSWTKGTGARHPSGQRY